MTEVEKDILARFAALERLTAYVLAGRLKDMAPEASTVAKRSMSGHQLRAGGLMSDQAIDDISIMADYHAERIVKWAAEMEADWRGE